MAQIHVQDGLQGPPHQPPSSTKPPSPPTPMPRLFVSGEEGETATGVFDVGGDASGSKETRVFSSSLAMSLDPVSHFSENTNVFSNNDCYSCEIFKVHVGCSATPGAVAVEGRARKGTMTMDTNMMAEDEEESSLARILTRPSQAQAADISWTMCVACTGSCLDTHQDRATSGGKRQALVNSSSSSSSSRNSNFGGTWRRTMLAVFVLLAISSTTSISAAGAPGAAGGGPERYMRLENPTGAAYDPLQPLTDQLMLPIVAGVPPPPPSSPIAATTTDTNADILSKEQQAYKDRLETERLERQGSFYVELTPLERQLAAASASSGPAGKVRYSKEPLPWEGMGQDEDGIDSEDDIFLGWSYPPWGGEFRYEILPDSDDGEGEVDGKNDNEGDYYGDEEEEGERRDPRRKSKLAISQRRQPYQQSQQQQQQQDEFSAMRVDNDDGSSVVEDQDWSRLELTTQPKTPSQDRGDEENKDAEAAVAANGTLKKVTQAPKMEESGDLGESVTNHPNVYDNDKEVVIDSQAWDAEGAAQTRPVGNTQLNVEAPLGSDEGNTKEETKEEKGAVVAPAGGRSFASEPIGSETLDNSMKAEVEMVRPKLDQIDLLGHEAEMDWLQEQDDIQRAWRMRHHRGSERYDDDEDGGEEEDEDEDVDVDVDEDEDEGNESAQEAPFSFRYRLSDAEWDKKHGGLNPKHSAQYKPHGPPRSKDRSEKEDRDEDGTIFPKPYSQDPYSSIVYPSNPQNPFSPLGYVAYNTQGDRIIDFSMVGWNEGNTDLPDPLKDVPVVERLSPRPGADKDSDDGDDTERIQRALDHVAQQAKANVKGDSVVPTGALVLERGVYRISKPLKIRDGGVLFRGDPAGGSRIVCRWEPAGPKYAIEIEGKKDKELHETRVPVVSDYTPVGSFFLALDPSFLPDSTLAVGDQVMVTRIGNDLWVEDIGMDDFDSDKKGVKPWKKMYARMFRTIRSLDPHTGIVQLDAPLPISIRRHYGGGWVTKYKDNKIRALGVQFLDLIFPKNIGRTIDDMLDEEGRGSEDYRFSHEIFANYALRIDCAAHVYVSHITTAFFHNFVSVGSEVHHLTLDSIVHSYPDDMLSGQSAFQLSGQLVLIKNTLSQGSFHFFVDINHVMGPNVVHRAQAINVGKPYQPLPLNFAPGEVGPHMKFCTGLLFDQVTTDGSIQIVNRGSMGTGQGYSGANSVVWNSRAREGVLTHRARGFQNFVIGSEDFEAEDRMPWSGHGWKEHLGQEVLPGSLYLRQMGDRLERKRKGWVS
ncbi:MAG: hypothetical protein J3R72DRAFT_485395 [Linnemannia gamsii]|nr:MAG: hypothetical protein J3R72DRAFT_485395 [Linnemannia gamsii]